MSQINVSPDEFADIIICFLLDNFRSENTTLLPDNELWTEFVSLLERRGLEPQTLRYYMKLDANTRVSYKRIKGSFESGNNETSRINISAKHESPDRKSKLEIKDTIKNVIKLAKQVRESTGFPVNDEKLDKIIDHVIKQEEQKNG